MIILGIDPGLATTGWGVIKKDKKGLSSLDYGVIKTSAKTKLSSRIYELHKDLLELIKKYSPSHLAVEKLFFNTNAKTAMIVGQARGVVLLAGVQNNLQIEEFTPLQIRLNIVGYGQADKMQVQKMVKTILKMEFTWIINVKTTRY